MFQIVFNTISAAELSCLDTLAQLDLLDQFKVNQDILSEGRDDRFGQIEREGKSLYRFRCDDYRVYFEVEDDKVIVHRLLHKNTFSDFLFRSKLPMNNEDEELSQSKYFWTLIDEGKAELPHKNGQ